MCHTEDDRTQSSTSRSVAKATNTGFCPRRGGRLVMLLVEAPEATSTRQRRF